MSSDFHGPEDDVSLNAARRSLGRRVAEKETRGTSQTDGISGNSSHPEDDVLPILRPYELRPRYDRMTPAIGDMPVSPKAAKSVLAWTIVAQFYGEEAANRAAEEFERRARGEDPEVIPEVAIPYRTRKWPNLLQELGLVESTSQGRALIKQGAVNFGPDREKVTDVSGEIAAGNGLVVRVGKRRIVRAVIT